MPTRQIPTQWIRAFAAYQFLIGLYLWLPIFYEYQRAVGLTPQRIFAIQSAYYVLFCVLEIPTGWLADRFGTLRCLRAGAIAGAVANFWPVAHVTATGFMIHFALIALSRSLVSGASSAYLYERLRRQGAVAEYKSTEGWVRSLGLIGKVVLWALVGPMMAIQMQLPYLVSALFSLASVAMAFTLTELPRAEARTPTRLRAVVSDYAAVVGRAMRPELGWAMIQGIPLFVLGRIVQVNLFQPLLNARGVELAWHGAVMSAMTVCEAVGSARPDLFTRVLGRRIDDRSAVSLFTGVMLVPMLALAVPGGATAWTGSGLGVLALCAFSFAMGIAYPIQRQVMNDAIQSVGGASRRATLLSAESLLDRAVCAAVAAALGPVLAAGQLTVFLWAAAGASVLCVLNQGRAPAKRSA